MERKSQRSTRGLGPDVVGDPRVRERLEERVAVGGVEEVAIDRDGGRGGHRSASLQDVPYSKLLPAVPLRLRLLPHQMVQPSLSRHQRDGCSVVLSHRRSE